MATVFAGWLAQKSDHWPKLSDNLAKSPSYLTKRTMLDSRNQLFEYVATPFNDLRQTIERLIPSKGMAILEIVQPIPL